jgi:hypothetical protein
MEENMKNYGKCQYQIKNGKNKAKFCDKMTHFKIEDLK